MIDKELLKQVRAAVSEQAGSFGVSDISRRVEARYDNSFVREAIWYLIDRGEVDLDPRFPAFVRVGVKSNE